MRRVKARKSNVTAMMNTIIMEHHQRKEERSLPKMMTQRMKISQQKTLRKEEKVEKEARAVKKEVTNNKSVSNNDEYG